MSGWSLHEVCNRIYEVYRHNSTVTRIVNEIIKDRETRLSQALRITKT